ncbi:MAG: glucosaminidase domain-containing protein [Hyphomicrobiaceae bacterium]|nr:glucosaminidase domain-containing protein [Hyphomicrobiaceae bacterium]
MQRSVAAILAFVFVSGPFALASAATLPEIRTSPRNLVPECATPGRLMEYLRSRNPDLHPRFDGVASEYMRQGEMLGVRWDFAFYQMILETGSLSYRRGNRAGDVRAAQNNFAGLGATGGGESGESFKDMPTGVRAHLEHLLLYAGEKLDNPVAERTRKVQEWGVLTKWQSRFTRPITFADLTQQWAPGSTSYARMLDGIAERFVEFCEKPDPRPELAAAVRRELRLAEARAQRPSGEQLAKRAIETGKAEESDQRAGLGAKDPPMAFKVLNGPPAEAEKLLADNPPTEATARNGLDATRGEAAKKPFPPSKAAEKPAADKLAAEKPQVKVASAGGAAKGLVEAAPALATGQKCRVWTASYGGQKALIIRSIVDKVVNYTVLDVNEGAEKREADAFIAAYAKEGAIAGEYPSQAQALDKAFELCPEG